MAESFNATIKKELIYQHTWPTFDQVKRAVFEYIEIYYNGKRSHTKIGGLSPTNSSAVPRSRLTTTLTGWNNWIPSGGGLPRPQTKHHRSLAAPVTPRSCG